MAFGEPVNAISNLAFAIAAVLAARRIRVVPGISLGTRLLPWVLATVALGSIVYHTYRSSLTFVVDLLPLIAFIVGSIFLVLRKVLIRPFADIFVGASFLILQIVLFIFVPADFLNGSMPHLITLLFISLLMFLTACRYGSLALQVAPISILYALAIVFRTIDLAICTWVPIGTHFLWHLAAAGGGYYVIRFAYLIEVVGRTDQGIGW